MSTNIVIHNNNNNFEEMLKKFCSEVKDSKLMWEIRKHRKTRKS